MIKEAMFYETIDDRSVRCTLCPWLCRVAPGKVGVCGVRENREGKLYSLIYNVVSSAAADPIEKKPLFHFHPGTRVYSVGTFGCNLRCGHCQNWQISRVRLGEGKVPAAEEISPARLVKLAGENDCQGIAWTYNEPTIWFEYCYDGAVLAKPAGLYTVWVTNGYITAEALDKIAPYLDAYRVDVKGFNNEFYGKLAGVRDFRPVLAAAERAKKKWGIHVEIVTNIIPTLNDDDEQLRELAGWMVKSLGPETPWHVTRFFPCLEYSRLGPTPVETLERAGRIGLEAGLKFVHLGNVPGHQGVA